MQLQHQVPDKRYLVRFRRVPVKIPAEPLEGSVRFRRVPVQIPCEAGSFRCRYSVRFRRVAVQILGSVVEGFGAGMW